RLHANSSVHATVFGPTPLKLRRNRTPSSRLQVQRNERSSDPRCLYNSRSSSLMRADFCRESPPQRMAASIEESLATRTSSHDANLRFRLSNARPLFLSVVDWESIVSINTSSGSVTGLADGTPYTARRFWTTYRITHDSA